MFFIDPEVCTGCGECKDACPCDAISEDENGHCVIDTDLCADCGANVIGLNPLNVLNHNYPEDASPYSSISREFLNPIYIDVEEVPEFDPADKEPLTNLLNELRSSELIEYSKIKDTGR